MLTVRSTGLSVPIESSSWEGARVSAETVSESSKPSSEGQQETTFTYPGGSLELPIVRATEGSDGVGLGKFLSETGLTTFDGGFVNTSACKSAITYIDGEAGILRYRGIPIEQLAERSNFIEVSYLLIYGELPTASELDAFTDRIRRHTLLHEDLKRFFDGFPRNAHPMPVLSSAVNALSAYYQDSLDPKDPEQVELSTVRLLAKLPTIAAYAYKKSVGQPFLYPDNSLSLVENFLRMTFGFPAEPYDMNPEIVKALDMLFVLHADHEQNCSTSTVRLVGSSQANLFTSISGGINALWGPLHGGANQAVLEMLDKIKEGGGDTTDFMNRVKNKEPGVKLMGFGHRVYKNYDPRAAIVKKTADTVLESLGVNDDLLDIAKGLEEVALNDDYFISRKLYPNVDFYTGLIYRAMGFPTRMFTVLFALGRLPGWIAHWQEMNADPSTKIGRPRQVYTGYTERDFAPLDQR
ncbi:citrate synthase [Williamsia sterculiae]|uniref:Citrate synthase n=1 Tax=Williamsia sterculiae TaxID=1344003 RepID=A0A1N7DEC0_9NOCA|nr:citrate synthase [Williamsia sterculiae]